MRAVRYFLTQHHLRVLDLPPMKRHSDPPPLAPVPPVPSTTPPSIPAPQTQEKTGRYYLTRQQHSVQRHLRILHIIPYETVCRSTTPVANTTRPTYDPVVDTDPPNTDEVRTPPSNCPPPPPGLPPPPPTNSNTVFIYYQPISW